MRSIAILAEEHRAIACVLNCLERLLRATVRTDALDGEAAVEILEYLERFADGSHQDKEELVLFPQLLARTTAAVRRSVAELLAQHEAERRALEELRARLEGAAYGDALSRDTFVGLAGAYVRTLREHARWEDEFLLPLAQKCLDARDDAGMLAGYCAIEERYRARGGRGPREMLQRIRARAGLVEAVGAPVPA
jgi:hemerythrin-like domain-containing protein